MVREPRPPEQAGDPQDRPLAGSDTYWPEDAYKRADATNEMRFTCSFIGMEEHQMDGKKDIILTVARDCSISYL